MRSSSGGEKMQKCPDNIKTTQDKTTPDGGSKIRLRAKAQEIADHFCGENQDEHQKSCTYLFEA